MNDMQRRIALGAVAAHKRGALNDVAEIAHHAGVSKSTVRKYLPGLIGSQHLRHTSYVRYFAPGPAAYALAEENTDA